MGLDGIEQGAIENRRLLAFEDLTAAAIHTMQTREVVREFLTRSAATTWKPAAASSN